LCCRLLNFGFLASFTLFAVVAISRKPSIPLMLSAGTASRTAAAERAPSYRPGPTSQS
jgi:hypothetical protein